MIAISLGKSRRTETSFIVYKWTHPMNDGAVDLTIINMHGNTSLVKIVVQLKFPKSTTDVHH